MPHRRNLAGDLQVLKDAVQKKASTICISRLSCPPAPIKSG
ncbi:hypothetical protein APV28_4555 [Comamonas testosteroni]|nr:hypothetical protein APV28_4555 [Comamonas testosteroni]